MERNALLVTCMVLFALSQALMGLVRDYEVYDGVYMVKTKAVAQFMAWLSILLFVGIISMFHI